MSSTNHFNTPAADAQYPTRPYAAQFLDNPMGDGYVTCAVLHRDLSSDGSAFLMIRKDGEIEVVSRKANFIVKQKWARKKWMMLFGQEVITDEDGEAVTRPVRVGVSLKAWATACLFQAAVKKSQLPPAPPPPPFDSRRVEFPVGAWV